MDNRNALHSLSNRPLYFQAMEAVMRYIAEARLRPGDALPTEDALALQLGVSRSTLREAMGILEREGLVTRRHGVGTFVAKASETRLAVGLHLLVPTRSIIAAAGLPVTLLLHETSTIPASAEMSALFGIPLGDTVTCSRLALGVDGQCVSYIKTFVPAALLDPQELKASGLTTLEYCLDRGRPALSHTQSEMYAVNADDELAQILGLPAGTAVMYLRETYYTADDQAVMLAHNYNVTDRFTFRIVRQIARLPERLRLAPP